MKRQKKTKKEQKKQNPQKKNKKLFFVHLATQADGLLEAPYHTTLSKKLKSIIQQIGYWAD